MMSGSAMQMPDPGSAEHTRSLGARLKVAWELEFANLRWGLFFYPLVARLLPDGKATAFRTNLVRAIGAHIGAGTQFLGMPKLTTSRGPINPRLRFGANCTIGTRVILEFAEVITIGDRVRLADGVVILTTTHQLGPKEHRAGPPITQPVVIGNDVEIGVDSIVLPGAKIGDGARVLANSVVNATVAPGVTVSGIPARPLRPSNPPATSPSGS